MKHTLTSFAKNFIKCGVFGWCMEVCFTSLNALRRRDYTLTGNTSVWMFPIYGAGCLLTPIIRMVRRLHWIIRGIIYMCCIFTGEYISGKWLAKKELCPWDYSLSKWHIHKIIRLDYAPCWFMVGLIYERILSGRHLRHSS